MITLMKKRTIAGVVVAGVVLLGAIGNATSPQQPAAVNTPASNTAPAALEEVRPVCDGTTITTNCSIDGIEYTTYIYHPAAPEKSHTETVTTYKQEIVSYCTLCRDGTYSPSCATGRGACSHHGGVAQWNAPRYRNVPEYTTKKVIDAPAKEAYYEKIPE